jgi:uracil-DNA glycosylase
MTAILIIGEAWGEHEANERAPFVGPSGWELTKMLSEAGISRTSCYLTNVFNFQPNKNDLASLCGPRQDSIPGYPAIIKGKYLRKEFLPELERLQQEIMDVNPNIIIAMGNTALWSLLGVSGISSRRGSICTSTHLVEGFKVLPTYHPAAILRQWDLRPVTVLDLHKARRESAFPEVVRPSRQVWIEPSLSDIEAFYDAYIPQCKVLSCDIETAGDAITCIGFAPSPSISLVIPFTDPRRARGSYWPTRSDELAAWAFVRRFLEAPCGKLFQNGMYDISFLWRSYGLRVTNPEHDTLLLHHALQPESPKSLSFLGSVYTGEASWKLMRKHGKTTIKQDD